MRLRAIVLFCVTTQFVVEGHNIETGVIGKIISIYQFSN